MQTDETTDRTESGFSPWSIKKLFIWWLLGFEMLPLALYVPIGFLVALYQAWIGHSFDGGNVSYIGQSVTYAISFPVFFAIILLHLKKENLTLDILWGPKIPSKFYLILPIAISVGLTWTVYTLQMKLEGSFSVPPPSPLPLDWHFKIALDFWVFGLTGPLLEEFFFRSIFYKSLRVRYGISGAILLSSLVFTILHFKLGILAPSAFFFIGICACILYERTQSLTPCFILHCGYNVSFSIVYYLKYSIP
ncbi:MAG: CPBP family intramembrane metalloprotease [bacterium]|nr:CPBP family intramembrane metalloprotease [bacterium]